jgi:uroporphyrinogen-III synthase
MRLLVTRPEPEAGALAEELRALGHEPVLQPLLEFKSLDFDLEPVRAADCLIFTSGNSLRALREKLDLAAIAATPIFCVGKETARRAREAGFGAVVATAETAEALCGKIVSLTPEGAKLVHVTGEHQAFDLGAALAREGLSLCTLTVYAMEARQEFDAWLVAAFQAGAIDGVIVMSPRTAEIFVSLCRLHELLNFARNLNYFCLAGSAAKKLEPLEPAKVHTAAKPDREALLALLAS